MAKISENNSPRPQDRSSKSPGKGGERPKNIGVGDLNGDGKVAKKGPDKKWFLLFALLFLLGACLFIFDRWGNTIFHKSTTNKTTSNQTPAKTCKDKETVTTDYKLFRSDKYKYCIQYLTDWPVNQTKANMVTFGEFNPEPTATWFRVTYFSGKSVTTRTNELKAENVEPNGPCVISNATIATQAVKKLACTGSFNGEIHVYYLVGEGSNLFELSYIEGMGAAEAPNDVIDKVMVASFLTDMEACLPGC